MPPLKIDLPDKFIYCTKIPIRIGDINRASHLSHVNLIQILEESRAQFIISLGYNNEVNICQGKGFILGDLEVIFKGQSHYGQVLQIEIGVADVREKSFDIIYKVSNAENGTAVAVAKTGILTFDYQKQKVIPITEELRDKLLN